MNPINLEIINNIESTIPIFEIKKNSIEKKENTAEKNILLKDIEVDEISDSKQLIFDLFDENDEFEEIVNEDDELIDLDMIEATEGKEQLELHIKKERSQAFMKKCKKLFALKDELMHCEICHFSFYERYGEIGIGFIEGHHTKPINELTGETKIKASEILMVCSNCHRIIHRKYPCLTKEEVIEAMENRKNL